MNKPSPKLADLVQLYALSLALRHGHSHALRPSSAPRASRLLLAVCRLTGTANLQSPFAHSLNPCLVQIKDRRHVPRWKLAERFSARPLTAVVSRITRRLGLSRARSWFALRSLAHSLVRNWFALRSLARGLDRNLARSL
ncbi:MAG: hypothetical protein RSA55_06790, partial [Clostridia bacterium]